MAEEYTPTDQQVIDDYMPDEEDIGFDARTMSMGEWKRLKIAAFDRWLAAHDARICKGARHIFLIDAEIIAFAKAMFSELERYGFFDYRAENRDEAYENAFVDEEKGQYGFDAIDAGINAVNQLRETARKEEES